jgi:hypothetical protein
LEGKSDGIPNEDYGFHFGRLVHQDRFADGGPGRSFVHRLNKILISRSNIGCGFAPFTDEESWMINNKLFKKFNQTKFAKGDDENV